GGPASLPVSSFFQPRLKSSSASRRRAGSPESTVARKGRQWKGGRESPLSLQLKGWDPCPIRRSFGSAFRPFFVQEMHFRALSLALPGHRVTRRAPFPFAKLG